MPPSHLSPSAVPHSGRHPSFVEREEIALPRARGHGAREGAGRLGRAPSHGPHASGTTIAQRHAERAARRPKAANLASSDVPQGYVADRPAGRIAHPDGTLPDGPRYVEKAPPWP
jgi:hypothetical protein